MGADLTSAEVTAKFEGGELTGFAGCNDYNATYELDGQSITIGPIAKTAKACEGTGDTVETAYLAALEKVGAWSVVGQTMTLSDASANTQLLIYQAAA